MSLLASQRARRGFTLIELLGVIASIAILIGLLLPAVQKVREAAARTKCLNNLTNLGKAFHMYQDTYGKLPPGWVTTNSVQPNPGWSWGTVVLPYIEQKPLFDQMAPDLATPGGPAVNALTQTKLTLYRCPSDPGQDLNANFQSFGTSNYVVNREVHGPDASNKPAALKVETIQDGSSNTIMVGERDLVQNIGAVWAARSSSSSSSFEGRPGKGVNVPNPGGSTGMGNCERFGFNSRHMGGANFLFGDGSVRFIPASIESDQSVDGCAFPASSGNFTLQKLIHPADGYPVTLP